MPLPPLPGESRPPPGENCALNEKKRPAATRGGGICNEEFFSFFWSLTLTLRAITLRPSKIVYTAKARNTGAALLLVLCSLH